MIYKITIIFSSKLINEEIDQIKIEIDNLIKQNEGEIKDTSQLQRKKMAYQIKHQDYGNYFSYYLEIDPSKIKFIDQFLKQQKGIIRYLIASIEIKNWDDFQNILKKSANLKTKNKRLIPSSSSKKFHSQKVKLGDLDKKLDEMLK